MKKIIAMLAALSMVASIGMTCVFAAEPDDLTINCDVTKFTAEEYEDVFGEEAGDNVGFMLAFSIEGLAADLFWTQNGSGTKATYSGRSIDAAGVTLESDVSNENIYNAFLDQEALFNTEDPIVAETFDGITLEKTGARMLPAKGVYNDGSDFMILYIAIPKGVEMNLTPSASIQLGIWEGAKTVASSPKYSNQVSGAKPLYFSVDGDDSVSIITLYEAAGSTTVDVTGVTLDKSELKLKVGGTYDLAETVAPDDATDKSVTYSSNNTSVATVDAATGVVTAVAVGTANITVTTKDGGKTATCAVTVYNDVVPASADAKVVDSTTKDLYDAKGAKVTIDPSRSYGAAKFENINLGAYNYKIVATDADGNEKDFEIADGDLEVSGTASFIAIVWSATRTITSVVLRAFNN